MQLPWLHGFLNDEEKNNLSAVTWDLIKRILGYLMPYWRKSVSVSPLCLGCC